MQILANQAVDTRIGAILIIFAFIVHVVTLWKGPKMGDLGPANRRGLVVGILVGLLVFVTSWWCSSSFSIKESANIKKILNNRINSESATDKGMAP